MTSLGFNPENVMLTIDPVMAMLVQANTPLTVQDLRNTLGTLEIIEAFDVTRAVILDHIIPEEVVLNRGTAVTIGTGKKYRKDKTFVHFWSDVYAEITDALYAHFTRKVSLSTGTKTSTHPMIRRVMKLIITPVMMEISNHSPESILKTLDTDRTGIEGKDVFGYMSRFMASADVPLHPEDTLVARKVLQKRCSTNIPKLNRILLIQDAAERLQEKRAHEDSR